MPLKIPIRAQKRPITAHIAYLRKFQHTLMDGNFLTEADSNNNYYKKIVPKLQLGHVTNPDGSVNKHPNVHRIRRYRSQKRHSGDMHFNSAAGKHTNFRNTKPTAYAYASSFVTA
jgi:hypothetical protein